MISSLQPRLFYVVNFAFGSETFVRYNRVLVTTDRARDIESMITEFVKSEFVITEFVITEFVLAKFDCIYQTNSFRQDGSN